MSNLEKKLLLVNALLYLLVAIFSYCYVDLNLTISQNPLFLKFVSIAQRFGYYNRPLSTFTYFILIVTAFSFFILNLLLFSKSKLSAKYLKISTLINTIVLILAYPFLSSDLFNYMFDAKIILNYHESPYTHKALDFPQDEWLRFMRWVHRYSPYGPLWLILSIVPAFLGFGKFILNLLMFKIFIGLFHLLNAYLVYKIVGKLKSENQLFATAFYALNPLFLIEGVANAHNDVVLTTFLLAAVYFSVFSKNALSIIFLLTGTLIKYIPILNLPFLIWHLFSKDKNIEKLILLNVITLAIFTFIFSTFRISVPFVSSSGLQVQFQPWYLFWTIPYIALLKNKALIIVAIAVCFGALMRYLPFLYYGNWSMPGVSTFMTLVVMIPLVAALIFSSKKLINK